MLPHFVEQDFQDVLDDLRQAGYPLRERLVRAALRVPLSRRSAASTVRGIAPRAAPGHRTLARPGRGSQPAAARRATSIPRSSGLQVKVQGLTDGRHVVTCNGRRVPLHPTGTNGEFVAGVRYRAWQPPSCLHPTIPVHSPLVFDVFDTWTGPIARRLHVPRGPSGRAGSRDFPGQRQRGREPPPVALLPVRPHAGDLDAASGGGRARVSLHARPA